MLAFNDTFNYKVHGLNLTISYLGFSLSNMHAFEVQAKKPYTIYLSLTAIKKLKKI